MQVAAGIDSGMNVDLGQVGKAAVIGAASGALMAGAFSGAFSGLQSLGKQTVMIAGRQVLMSNIITPVVRVGVGYMSSKAIAAGADQLVKGHDYSGAAMIAVGLFGLFRIHKIRFCFTAGTQVVVGMEQLPVETVSAETTWFDPGKWGITLASVLAGVSVGLIAYNGKNRDEEEENEFGDSNPKHERGNTSTKRERVNKDDRFTMIGLDNEIPLGYDDYESMSQLPIATVDDKEADDEFALVLAECGVIQEHSSTLMSSNQRSKRSDERPRLSFFSEASQQPSADSAIPTRANKAEPAKRKRSRRRSIGNIAIGLTTTLLASWFAWCGIIAWHTDSQASSLKSPASHQVSYQTIDIEKLKKGDTVIAMNPETGEVAAKKVLQTFERVADHLQIVTLEYSDGTSQVIETTDEHPFWLRFEKKWTRAADLKHGDTVTGPNDEIQTVTDNFREEYPEGITVYNFEVEDWHTYFVFANGSRAPPVLVHNANYTKDQIAKRMGRVAEGKGWRDATERLKHIGIKSPYSKNLNTGGSDYMTYNPKTRRLHIWDAKYRQTRQYPASPTAKQKSDWRTEARKYIKEEFDGTDKLRPELLDALNKNRVTFEIYGWPT